MNAKELLQKKLHGKQSYRLFLFSAFVWKIAKATKGYNKLFKEKVSVMLKI